MVNKETIDPALEIAALRAKLDAMNKAVEILAQYPTEIDKAVENFEKAIASLRELNAQRFDEIEHRLERVTALCPAVHEIVARVDVADSRIEGLDKELEKRLSAQREAAALALAGVEKATAISQATADRAMARAEAAADRALMESMIAAVRDNFAGQIEAVKESLLAAMGAAKEAVAKSEAATEKRFESVNEFRGQMGDQATRFMPRLESETMYRSIAEKVDGVASRMDRYEGRSTGMDKGWGIIIAIVGMGGIVLSGILGLLAFAS